jgi:NAD(P)H-flavin reductase
MIVEIADRRKITSNHRWKKLNWRPDKTSVIMTRYSAGMFIRINMTELQKYIPISCARINTIMFDDRLDEIV